MFFIFEVHIKPGYKAEQYAEGDVPLTAEI